MQKTGKYLYRETYDATRGQSIAIVAALLLACLIAACTESDPPIVPAAATCIDDGMLTGQLFGSYKTALDWREGAIDCGGMPRPHGEGARLRFAGIADAGGAERRLAFILGIPDLVEAGVAKELPTNVTLMEEGGGRFFSTPDMSTCWADIDYQELQGGERRYRIGGVLYCVAPLPEMHGTGSVSFADLRFAGEIDWEPPE